MIKVEVKPPRFTWPEDFDKAGKKAMRESAKQTRGPLRKESPKLTGRLRRGWQYFVFPDNFRVFTQVDYAEIVNRSPKHAGFFERIVGRVDYASIAEKALDEELAKS